MIQEFKKILYFLVLILAVVVLLMVLNLISHNLNKEYMREFSSYEAVERHLNIKNVYRPGYLPENIIWPPIHILAQKRPYITIISEYKDRRTDRLGLIIIQTEGTEYYKNKEIELNEIKEKTRYTINQVSADLEVGLCHDGLQCSRLSWHFKGFKVIVIIKAPPFELLKIAESMVK